MKKTILVALAISLAIAAVLLAGSTGFFALSTAQSIKVAWIGPLSGIYASIGSSNMKGVEIAVDKINAEGGINGRNIELVVEDTQGDTKLFLNALQKLSAIDNINIILTSQYTELFAAKGFAEKNNIVLVNAVDASNQIAALSDNIFGIGIYDEGIGHSLAEFAAEKKGYKRIGIVFLNSEAFLILVKSAFKEKLESLGGKIGFEAAYGPNENDFRTIIEKAKGSELDALLVLGYDETGFLLRQARELGFEKQFLGIDLFASKQFLANAGGAAEGAIFTFWQPDSSKESREFSRVFEEKFNEAPREILFASTGFDAMSAVAFAMKNNGISTGSIKKGLLAIKDLKGLAGSLTMSPDGIVRTVKEEIFVMEADNSFHPTG